MTATPPQRIVPGAPPPPQISASKSSQKKKKKAAGGATAVVDDTSAAPSPLTATQNLEVVTNGTSNQGTPPAPSTPAAVSPSLQKLSPIVDLINKRLKTNQKKVKRIKEYSSSGTELNEDQKRSVAILPGLEAVVKELEEVKKAIEVHESELSKEESVKKAAADEAAKATVTQAVADAKATGQTTARLLLAFVRLSALINDSHPILHNVGVTDIESFAITSAVETLTGEESQSKEDIISGLFSGEGELQGVAYSRLIEIAHIAEYPHQRPSEEGAAESAVDEHDAGAGTTAHGHTGGLLFVQESELDNEADVPAVGDVPPTDSAAPYEEEPEPEPELEHKPAEVAEPIQTSGPIDWSAEEEHDLPPISGLQESFGEAQPAPPVVDDQVPQDDGGFTTHGGRGRGPRDERRGGRGGYRGEGGRGSGRGGSYGDRGGRGSHRGRGGGDFRGRGEGYRGRGDGEWRGRGDGERRGRGDGEWRGRSDGEGRGRNDGEGRSRGDGEWRGRSDGEWRGRSDGSRRGDGYEGYRGHGRGRGEGRGGPPPQPQ